MVANIGAIRTFSFLSVATGEGELYNYQTTIITTTPVAIPIMVSTNILNTSYSGVDALSDKRNLDSALTADVEFSADPNESGIEFTIVAKSLSTGDQQPLYTGNVSEGEKVNYTITLDETVLRALYSSLSTGGIDIFVRYSSNQGAFTGVYLFGTIQ